MPLRPPALAHAARAGGVLACVLLAVPGAGAQTPFTELALSDSTITSPGSYIDSAAPADVDGDGDLDLLTIGAAGLVLYRNNGVLGDSALALAPTVIPTGDLLRYGADLAWGDYDNDGDLDVVLGTRGRVGDYLGEMVLFRNDGGTLTQTPTVLPGHIENGAFDWLDYRSLTWADYDNDGDLDLYVPASHGLDGDCCDVSARLLRNDGPGAGDAWTFADTAVPTPYAFSAVTAWADKDLDGDLDFFLANFDNAVSFTRTYRNDGGVLVEDGPPLPDIWDGTADWGDADGDGDLDVLVAGGVFSGRNVRIYLNEGTGYDSLLVASPVPGEPEDYRAASWADYDSDGDVDVLVAAALIVNSEFIGRARVYANDGAGHFTLAAELPAPTESQYGGTVVWFDVDADGDLDYFISGAYKIPGPSGNDFEFRAQLFRNDAPAANAPPTAPAALSAVPVGDDAVLSWAPSTDDHTPTASLTYNLWVRTVAGSDIVSPMSRGGGVRMLPEAGNVSHSTSRTLRGLPPGTYTWTVQAVDNAFNGGAFAAEGTFTIGVVAAEPGAGPAALALRGVLPNPATGAAAVVLDLPAAAAVGLTVFDVLGREVLAVPAARVEAGAGREIGLAVGALPAGTYLVRAEVRSGAAVEYRTARVTVRR